MDDAVFQGKVIKHPAYVQLENENPDIKQYTSEFKSYWVSGFSPLIGKDGVLPEPDIYSSNAIGRAHVEPPVKTDETYSSTADAWELWGVGTGNVVPTSNSFLVYCINEKRECCLLAFLDDKDGNSHKILRDDSFRRDMKFRSEEYFNRFGAPMPKDEHEHVFDEKWLK